MASSNHHVGLEGTAPDPYCIAGSHSLGLDVLLIFLVGYAIDPEKETDQ